MPPPLPARRLGKKKLVPAQRGGSIYLSRGGSIYLSAIAQGQVLIANLTTRAEQFHILLKRTMNWINQQTVWIFGLVAGTATIGSFIIAFIVNREKLWDFLRKYWFFIVGFFALVGLFCLCQFSIVSSAVHGLLKWMGFSVAIWAGFVAVAIVAVCWWIYRNITVTRIPDERIQRKPEGEPAQVTVPKANPKLSPANFGVRDYVEDSIDGVWWHWTYSGNTVDVPTPICPNRNCQCDLFFREDWNRMYDNPNGAMMIAPPVTLHCPRCSFRQDFSTTEPQVLNSVSQEILSRIRTDRFRKILYDRAMNPQITARQN
jgi:hypothetical protein